MILLNNYYFDKNPERQKELDACLVRNIENEHIKIIILFHDKNVPVPNHAKIIPVVYRGRPTYSEYFRFGNFFRGIKILANSDIYFNDTIQLCERINDNEVYALCRWNEINENGDIEFYKKRDSQDVWIWKGKINVEANFSLGKPGCDGSIAHILQSFGLRVLNPSQSIQSIHIHRTEIRNYDVRKDLIPGPYLFLDHFSFNHDKPVVELAENVIIIGENDPIDVVYILGSGSRWYNNELRFSLRSLQKNLIGYRNIYVIGENPGFLSGIRYVKHPDELGPSNADGNIARKVLKACSISELSDNFLFINDDHIIIKPVNVRDIPPYHKGDMNAYPDKHFNSGQWRRRLYRTREVLRKTGLTTYNFDCHVPMLINKHLFPKALSMFDYEFGIGYTMKSMYGNVVFKDLGAELYYQKKTVFNHYSLSQIEHRLASSTFMSFNDDGINASLKKFLHFNFPIPSQYETGNISDPYIEVLDWIHKGKNYADGVALFSKFMKNRNMIRIFNHGETPDLRVKLEYKLKTIIDNYERN